MHYRVSSSVPGDSRCSRRTRRFYTRRCRFVLLSPRAFSLSLSLSFLSAASLSFSLSHPSNLSTIKILSDRRSEISETNSTSICLSLSYVSFVYSFSLYLSIYLSLSSILLANSILPFHSLLFSCAPPPCDTHRHAHTHTHTRIHVHRTHDIFPLYLAFFFFLHLALSSSDETPRNLKSVSRVTHDPTGDQVVSLIMRDMSTTAIVVFYERHVKWN